MIGLIAAMPQEVAAVTKRMTKVSKRTVAKVEFTLGWMDQTEVVIALSGVGKVAAAIASTLMCQLYQPSLIINVGVAGGLKDEQEVGDLVISDKLIQADFDTTAIDGEAGQGQSFDADPVLVNMAVVSANDLDIPCHVGAVATQDLFMSRPEDFQRLMNLFPQSVCSEMEGGAVAQVAKQFQIPFVAIRSLSDIVVHEGNPMEFSQFTEMSSENAAKLFEKFVQLYEQSKKTV